VEKIFFFLKKKKNILLHLSPTKATKKKKKKKPRYLNLGCVYGQKEKTQVVADNNIYTNKLSYST